jgi:uncharacterized Rossmann fold enzyme
VLYEIINPSDPITVEADDETVACVSVLVIGEGRYGLKDQDGRTVCPLFLFGGAMEWLAKRGVEIQSYLRDHETEIVACLESAAIGSVADRIGIIAAIGATGDKRAALRRWNESRRTSVNDICGCAHRFAQRLRTRAK